MSERKGPTFGGKVRFTTSMGNKIDLSSPQNTFETCGLDDLFTTAIIVFGELPLRDLFERSLVRAQEALSPPSKPRAKGGE